MTLLCVRRNTAPARPPNRCARPDCHLFRIRRTARSPVHVRQEPRDVEPAVVERRAADVGDGDDAAAALVEVARQGRADLAEALLVGFMCFVWLGVLFLVGLCVLFYWGLWVYVCYWGFVCVLLGVCVF